jgi:ribosome-associated protein
MATVRLGPGVEIEESELEFSFVRSSGPGGQNVNKVNSKAVLRWNLAASPSLRAETRARLLERLGTRLTRAGELLVASDRWRDQPRNREDCVERLRALVTAALHVDRTRRATRPTRGSQRRRVAGKALDGRKKALRRKPGRDD